MKKKLLSLLLVLCLTLSLLPFGAAAAEAQTTIRQTYVNPDYAGVLSESDLVPLRTPLRASATVWQTPEEAANELRAQLKNHVESIPISIRLPERDDAIGQTIYDLAVSHTGVPTEGDSLKWVVGGWEMKGTISTGSSVTYRLTYTVTYYTTPEQEQTLTDEVNRVLASLNLTNLSWEDTVRAIYAYVCDHVTYDHTHLEDDSYLLKYTAYAALIDGTAVCQGYAALLYRLLLEAGIDCRVVSGVAGGGNHGWNIVEMGESWYFLDSTWDAGQSAHDYELIGETALTADHALDAEYTAADFRAEYPVSAANFVSGSIPEIVSSGVCGENVTWTLDSTGCLAIRGQGDMTDYVGSSSPFNNLTGMNRVRIKSGVTSIGSFAFVNKRDLQSIFIPRSVTRIGRNAFANCSGLTSVSLPSGVTALADSVFTGCSGLTAVALPTGLKSIGDSVFYQCSGLTEIALPDGVTAIGENAFDGCTGLTSVTLPASLTSVSPGAFRYCSGLESVGIPAGVTDIGLVAFFGCSSLKTLTLPESLKTIGNWAFGNCSTLTQAVIPDGVTAIGDDAFYGCTGLQSVQIPVTVTSIGSGAFDDCGSLTDVWYPDYRKQWNQIEIGSDNDPLLNAHIHFLGPDIEILSQPQDFTGKPGDVAVFTVDAAGEGLTYQWQYQNPGGSWKNSASTSNQATCTLIAARDGRLYRCIITDAYGDSVTSEAAKIIVKTGPVITAQPQNFTGKPGDVAVFTISAEGEGLTYQWQYKNPGSSTWRNSASTTNQATCTLTAARDGRLYRCIIKDAYGNSVTSASAKIIVKTGPVITAQPQDFTGKPGDVAVFTVSAEGEGLTYQWQYKNPGSSTWRNSASTTNQATCTLTAARDGRLYRCIITDADGSTVTSAAAKIIVKTGPVITAQPQNFTGKTGDVAVFTISAQGDGLTYQWQYKNPGSSTWKNSASTTNQATCTLTAARDGRLYRCIITDAYGNTVTSASAKIIVQ